MLTEYIMAFVEFLKGFSYFGIMLALCFEFVPAEVVLPLAGFWVYEGDFNYYLVVIAGAVGGTIGPLTLYYLGKWGGRPMVIKYGKYFLVSEKQINASDRFFEKYGAGVAFFGRFLPVVRTAISVPCGISEMNVIKFCVYTFIAILPITALYVYIGFTLGENWELAGPIFKQYTMPIVYVIISGLAIYSIYRIIKNRRMKKDNI
ncbi:DedA family protein [Alkalihalobacillus sp. FSL R5-0424]